MDGIYIITSISDNINSWYQPYYINHSLLIFSIGFLFKVSAAPFHFWSPAIGFGKSYTRDKLSNSGDTLELFIPSYFRKNISLWFNSSCEVINKENPEKEVGYRGSKSDILSVKEQRVYGSWRAVFSPRLRCTLTGIERNSILKIPSKQILKSQLFSTLNTTSNVPTNYVTTDNNLKVSPWFVTGFADAEGCFTITIRKGSRNTLGW